MDPLLVRYYRSRDMAWLGSFGPGGFCNYDIKLTAQYRTHTGAVKQLDEFLVFDPAAMKVYVWSEGSEYLDSSYAPLTPSGSGPPSTAKYINLKASNGFQFRFEILSLDTESVLEARLVRMEDSRGYGTSLTYKTWTPAEILASPERQYQIDKVIAGILDVLPPVGDASNTLTFSYGTTQVSGRWAVSKITTPNGDVDYTYTSGRLSSVQHPDGSTSTFAYSQVAPSSDPSTPKLDKIAIFDPVAAPTHRAKDVYLTKNNLEFTDGYVLMNQAAQLVRVIRSHADEVTYMSRSGQSYEGAGRMKGTVMTSTGNAVQSVKFVKAGWGIDFSTVPPSQWQTDSYDNGVTFSSDAVSEIGSGTPDSSTDDQGVTHSYEYDNGSISQITYSDSTYETFCYNNLKLVTRHRDRLGRVTLSTYDAQGNVLARAVGLQEANGNTNKCATNDVQAAGYAVTTYEYYGAMDTNKYLLKKITDPNGNATNYEYDSNHRLTKVIQPPDIAMGPRAETTYAYDTAGRLATVTAPDSSDTSYEYDAQSRVKKITYEDGTTERKFYGTGTNAGLLVKAVDRRGAVTDYTYDNSGRVTKITTGEKTMDAGGTESTLSPSLKVEEGRTYLNGTDLVQTVVKAGEKTEYVYDNQQRVVEAKVTASTGKTLVSKKTYVDNKLFSTEDPYGRKTFHKYDTSDSRLIRAIQGTVPSVTYADYTAVAAASRPAQNAANATSLITDYQYNAEGEITKVTDPRGYEHTAEYDSRGRVIADVKADGTAVEARTETVYDDASNVIEIRTPRYFDSGDTNGHTKAKTTMTYTGRNRLKTRTEAPGTPIEGTETLSYDLMRRVVSRVDMRGKTWSTAYPTCCGRTTTSTDPLGHGTIAHTDANGQVTHVIAVSDVSSHMSLHNPTDNKTHREVTAKYDMRGRKVAETVWLTPLGLVDPDDPPIYTGTPVNDSANPPMVSTYGLTTTWTYDDDLDDGFGLDSTFSTHVAGLSLGANCDGSAVLITGPSGERSLTISDGAGRETRTVQVNGIGNTLASKTIAHDVVVSISGYGNVLETASTNQAGHTVKARADSKGRIIEAVDGAGKVSRFELDSNSNRLRFRDATNVGFDCIYDALNRETQCIDTASNVASTTTYDLAGNVVTQVDAKANSSTAVYDARGRQVRMIDRLGGETEWVYDLDGNELSMKDAENQTTSYDYDDLGRRIRTIWPDHISMSAPGTIGYGISEFAFTPIGQILRMTDQRGDTLTSNYDLAGRSMQRVARTKLNSPSGPAAHTDTFTYDATSRLLSAISGQYSNTVSRSYQDGRLSSEALTVGGQTYTTGVAYDMSIPKVTLTYPDGTTVERTLNSRGLLSALKLGSATVLSRTYDDASRLSQQTLGNGVVENFGYVANDYLPVSRETGVGDFSYTWDANENKTAESITGPLSGYSWTTGTNGFDEADRLLQRSQGSGGTQLNESWALSLVGDMESTTTNSATVSRTHGPAHSVTAVGAVSINEDLKGNVRNDSEGRTFGWDWNDQLVSCDVDADGISDVTFAYDALARRTAKTANGTTTVFVSLIQEVIADYTLGSSASAPLRNYVSTGVIDEPVVLVDKTGAGAVGAGTVEVFYYHYDSNGHVRGLTDSSGSIQELYAYSSYGAPKFLDSSGGLIAIMGNPVIGSPLGNRFLFTAREWDPDTKTYDFRFRVFIPSLARFANRDPLMYEEGAHAYFAYFAPNDVDPDGLVGAGEHHGYPCYLGGKWAQQLWDLTAEQHQKCHKYWSDQEMPKETPDKSQTKWKTFTKKQQRQHVIDSLKCAGIDEDQILEHIDDMMDGSNAGTATPRKGPTCSKKAIAPRTGPKKPIPGRWGRGMGPKMGIAVGIGSALAPGVSQACATYGYDVYLEQADGLRECAIGVMDCSGWQIKLGSMEPGLGRPQKWKSGGNTYEILPRRDPNTGQLRCYLTSRSIGSDGRIEWHMPESPDKNHPGCPILDRCPTNGCK